ncbi:MAG TPA: exopolysaccharide biosynthesis polyprenyl glycosylphosphotransferase [Pseudonocardia sp.]|nr:exopolysaccharide biosynthesis polyprenyl glycosylphosphotransferase [Pseudonocardia sp.]
MLLNTTRTVLGASVLQAVPFVLGPLWLVHLLSSSGSYRFDRSQPWAHQVAQVMGLALFVGLGVAAAAALFGPPQPGPRGAFWWTVAAAGGLIVLHTGWWILVRRWRRLHWLTPNLVLIGATTHAERLINEAIARRHINVLGIFDDRLNRSPLAVHGVPVLGSTETLLTHRILPNVDLIVITVDPSATVRVREIMSRLAPLPNSLTTLMVDQEEETAQIAAVAHLADAPLAPVDRPVDPDRKAIAKRIQDLVIGLPMLLLVSPLLAAATMAVRLDSPGPVFFRQRRHGFNNEVITVLKFRTMRHEDADTEAARKVESGDERITRIGRILRRTSIDELPQLLNVIRGEMSLVGPRPHAIGMRTGEMESAQLVAEYAHRHRIKPGLTGWAAVNGSRGPLHTPADVKRRVALDVEYIERQTLWLDLKILLLTGPRLLGARSAVR